MPRNQEFAPLDMNAQAAGVHDSELEALAADWDLTQDERARLWSRPVNAPKGVDTELTLIAIRRLLAVLYGQVISKSWMRTPNTNPRFGGMPPLDYILCSPQPSIAASAVARLLASRLNG